MFIFSQLLLNFYKCNKNNIPSYSIVVGLLLYATIYLYILYKHTDYIVLFNKFIIYIVGVDLLISSVYYLSNNSFKNNNFSNLTFTPIPSSLPKIETNDTENNYDSDVSDDELLETDVEDNVESEYDDDEDNENEILNPKIEETLNPKTEEPIYPKIEELFEPKIEETSEPKIEETSEPKPEPDLVKNIIPIIDVEKKRRGRPKKE